MTYDTKANSLGKQVVQIAELTCSRCTRVYGSAPCTAAIGVTGSDRCYNTRATCQDTANYVEAPFIYRFSTGRVDGLQAAGEMPTIPTLMSVKTSPAILTPGKGLGVRSSVSLSIQDHPWTDVLSDPYRDLRTYDPDAQGTFWGRWLFRNRFHQNRRLDVLTGFLEDDGSYVADNFKRRSYIVSKISGPTTGGVVSIEGVDPLKLADGEKAQWPMASTAVLTNNESAISTSIEITDPDLTLVDWWAAGQRYIKVEDEIMHATAASGVGTTAVTLTCTRGSMPAWYDFSQNVAYAHDAGASVQPCWLFDNQKVYDIVYFLLNDVAGIDSAYLPLSEWTAEIENGYGYLSFSALLTEPKSVKDLLTEITQLSVLIWWHEREQKVLLKGLRFVQLIGPQINDDESIIANSVGVTEDTSNLTTESWIYYALQWPLANMDLLRSYLNVDVRANLGREAPEEYGKPAIKQVTSRWLPRSAASVVIEIGSTILRQYQDVRKVITWAMDPKDDAYWVGDTVGISTRYVQDGSGANLPFNALITQVEEVNASDGLMLKYTATELYSYVRTGVISHPDWSGSDPVPAPPDYSLASATEKNHWAFICYNTPADPLFLDGSKAYQIV